jgi:hypothetical protein
MAPSMNEKGTLLLGIEHEGKVHKEFELRPKFVSDSIDAIEDERAQRNESYLGLCILSKQIVRLGDIPKEKITPELLMSMYEVDMGTLTEASRRLENKQLSFRDADKTV